VHGRQAGGPLLDQLAERRRVGCGPAPDLVDRALQVAVDHEAVAVGLGEDGRRVGVYVLQSPLRGESELVVDQQRVGLDQYVRGRAGVVRESRQRELLGHGVATGQWTCLQDDDAQPRLGEVAGADEAVVPGADDDDVRLIRQRIGKHRHRSYGCGGGRCRVCERCLTSAG
jgi:hypothetical protein